MGNSIDIKPADSSGTISKTSETPPLSNELVPARAYSTNR